MSERDQAELLAWLNRELRPGWPCDGEGCQDAPDLDACRCPPHREDADNGCGEDEAAGCHFCVHLDCEAPCPASYPPSDAQAGSRPMTLLPWQRDLVDRLLERDLETGEFVVQATKAAPPAAAPAACPFCHHPAENHDDHGRCDVDAGISRAWVRCHGDPASPLPAIWQELQRERERAHRQHGETSMESADPDDPFAVRRDIITEEWGEVAKEYNEARHENRPVNRRRLRAELIQVAAMAAAWADALKPSAHVQGQSR